jgi:hypothetical protein
VLLLIKVPLFAAGGAKGNQRNPFQAQRNENDRNDIVGKNADRLQPILFGLKDQGVGKEIDVEALKIQAMLFDILAALWFIPQNPHRTISENKSDTINL